MSTIVAEAVGLFPDLGGHWLAVRDADSRATALYSRHYSATNRPRDWRNGIGGPGPRMVLLTADCRALFVWRHRPEHVEWHSNGYDDGQRGVMCTVFRNEGPILSSDLIREADDLAWRRWPGERHFTYVDAGKVKSPNPGYCFLRAGYRKCGRSKGGLLLLERLP